MFAHLIPAGSQPVQPFRRESLAGSFQVQDLISRKKMLQHEHDIVQFPHFNFRPGMQKENEELESLEEGHPLPVHRHVTTLILVQKSFTESDQPVEARQATGIIQWFWSDPEIVELDGSHPRPQERAKEQTKIFGGFCFTAGIKINKANFSLV